MSAALMSAIWAPIMPYRPTARTATPAYEPLELLSVSYRNAGELAGQQRSDSAGCE